MCCTYRLFLSINELYIIIIETKMKRLLLIPILSGMTGYLYAQAPADTTLNLQNVEVQGARFAGLSERQGMRYLNVTQNLSSVTNTTAEALRQLPSVITDLEGMVTFRGSNQVGMLINGVPYGLMEGCSGCVGAARNETGTSGDSGVSDH